MSKILVEAIWRLQKHFPLAFPVNPAPKVPLKEGILKDAEQHLELLGISSEAAQAGHRHLVPGKSLLGKHDGECSASGLERPGSRRGDGSSGLVRQATG